MSLTPPEKAEVIVGGAAEDFVESDLGEVIIGMAKQDAESAVLAFMDCDVTDQAKLANIQQDLRVARRFAQYLNELIIKGRETYAASTRED